MPLLKDHRSLLGFSRAEVAKAAGLSDARLRQIEEADDLLTHEADALSDLLGVSVADLLEGEGGELPVAALLRGNSTLLDATSRFAIAEAARVAEEAREIERLLECPQPWRQSLRDFEADKDYRHPREGTPERLARRVRDHLGLDSGAVPSVHAVLATLGVLVLWVQLPRDVDAFAFADETRGPVIVCNADGVHMHSAFVRRVTLAHELCHVLFDRPLMQKVGRFCQIVRPPMPKNAKREPESLEDRLERRARAFAAYFLVPGVELREFWARRHGALTSSVRAVMETYGLGYEAARAHLHNMELLPLVAKMRNVETRPSRDWEIRDPGLPQTSLTRSRLGVPLLRSGYVFDLVASGVQTGAIGESLARDYLRLDMSKWSRVAELVNLDTGTWRTSTSVLGAN